MKKFRIKKIKIEKTFEIEKTFSKWENLFQYQRNL